MSDAIKRFDADAATTRPGGRTARTRAAVIQATLDELSEVGYAALRVDQVAARAGVNKTTIYRRWGNRAALVATALIERQGELVPPPDTGDLRTDVVELLTEIAAALQTPWIAAIVREVGSSAPGEDGIRAVLDQLWPERFKQSRVVFERAIERGNLPADADPDFLLEALCGPLYFRWLMLGQPFERRFIERTTDLVLAGATRGERAAV